MPKASVSTGTDEPELVEFLRAAIRDRGPVSFASFMEQALYHPKFGYYSSGRAVLGRGGDYFTSVSVGPMFGRLLAAQFAEMWRALGSPDEFTIVEQGAADGEFGGDVLEAARRHHEPFFAAARYVVVEPFPVLENRQRARLSEFADRVSWKSSLAEIEPFVGVHFSNELLDALPVHLIAFNPGPAEWRERCVGLEDDQFVFVENPIADESLRDLISKIPAPGVRYETEINRTALNWIDDVSARLLRGYVLIADYGHTREEFYSPLRTEGTLRCRARHRIVPSPLTEIGRADITAHVEWTSLAERAEARGLNVAAFTDQHHFITGLLAAGVADLASAADRRALQTLLHPELLGASFQFLALKRNAPRVELSGFRFALDSRAALGLG